jgi:hypothetical protein
MGYPYFYWAPAALLHNTGKGAFVDVAAESGIEPQGEARFLAEGFGKKKAPRSTRCAAVADFDRDGRVDIMVNPFNDRAAYWHNVSAAKPWIGFRLTGTVSNRDAVGALVRVTSGGRTQVRQVQAAGGYLSQESKTLHFGLAGSAAIERVEIVWPNGGMQIFEGAKMGVVNVVSEPSDLPRRGK